MFNEIYERLTGAPPGRRVDTAFDVAGFIACGCIALFIVVTMTFGRRPSPEQYGTVLMLGLVAIFMLRPGPLAKNGIRTGADRLLSIFLSGLAIYAWTYMMLNYHAIASLREGLPNTADLWCYAFGTIAVVFAAHRAEGWPLAAIVISALAYLMFGEYVPGRFSHRPFGIQEVLEISYSYQGIFGVALAATVDIVYIFIILGVAVRLSGAGQLFSDLALMLAHGRRSGPAQCAIIASTLFGSINGSAPANVASTGVLTIPMMRRAGYRARFAGGVEATASCVGQVMPPVMGVGVFIMSDITGIPYTSIMLAAIIPALLYVASLSVAAMLEAQRLKIPPFTPEMPAWNAQRLSSLAVLLTGFGLLLALLFSGYPPTYCGLAATGAIIVLTMILPAIRLSFSDWVVFIVDSGRDGLAVLMAVAAIGIVIAGITTTGMGIKLNQMVAMLGQDSLFLALVLAALCCIVLGLGLPTAASYLMVIFVAGPAIMNLGIGQLETHLFVFYYAVLSAITPPIALAVFAASAIAREKPLLVAGQAMKLAVVGFLLPLAWIYHPEIMIGAGESYLVPALAYLPLLAVAVVSIAAGATGQFWMPLGPLSRVVLLVAGFCVFLPGFTVTLAGAGVGFLLLGHRVLQSRRVVAG